MKSILALDLGTNCGWAVRTSAGRIHSDVAKFNVRLRETPGHRFVRFRAHLAEVCKDSIDRIYYEEVMHFGDKQVLAAHLYGGFRAFTLAFADVMAIPCYGVGVTAVKRSWTGKGGAKKDAMLAEARRRGFHVTEHDEADALAILHHGIMQEDGPESVIQSLTRICSVPQTTATEF